MTLEEEFAYLAYDITDTWVYNGSYKIPSLPTADNYIINIHQNTFIDSTFIFFFKRYCTFTFSHTKLAKPAFRPWSRL